MRQISSAILLLKKTGNSIRIGSQKHERGGFPEPTSELASESVGAVLIINRQLDQSVRTKRISMSRENLLHEIKSNELVSDLVFSFPCASPGEVDRAEGS